MNEICMTTQELYDYFRNRGITTVNSAISDYFPYKFDFGDTETAISKLTELYGPHLFDFGSVYFITWSSILNPDAKWDAIFGVFYFKNEIDMLTARLLIQ